MIRLLATDLDGTFWGPDLMPPPAHVAAVQHLQRRGVTVLAATSRRPRVVAAHLAAVGLRLPAVLLDGAVGIDLNTGQRFHRSVFGRSDALDTLAVFRAHGIEPCLYLEEGGRFGAAVDVVVSAAPSTSPGHLASLGAAVATGDLTATAATAAIHAMSVLGVRRSMLEPLATELDRGAHASVMLYPERSFGQFGLIASPRGTSKWSGVSAWCAAHGIAPHEVAAVGDGRNDVEMLCRAGVRIGVRGGNPEVLALAQHVVDPPEHSGWCQIVDLVDAVP